MSRIGPIIRLIAQEQADPRAPWVRAVAEAARRRHGSGIIGVLFYGSCLRERDDTGKIVDLYLIAESYALVHPRPLSRFLNRLLPPNVYYLEAPFEDRKVRAKYALMTLEQLERLVHRRTLQSYFWARFAQPTVVLWARDDDVRERIVRALAQAVVTTALETRSLLGEDVSSEELWSRAFVEAYRTELRAERPGRAGALYRTFAERYDELTMALCEAGVLSALVAARARRRAERRWQRRRMLGKTLSVLRLMKSAFTFEGGPAYLMWKIERHSGVKLALTPWQHRHPILASTTLFWRLYRAGGFR